MEMMQQLQREVAAQEQIMAAQEKRVATQQQKMAAQEEWVAVQEKQIAVQKRGRKDADARFERLELETEETRLLLAEGLDFT